MVRWVHHNRGNYNNSWVAPYAQLQSGYRVGLAIHKDPNNDHAYVAEGALLRQNRVFDGVGARRKTLTEAKKVCEKWLADWTKKIGKKR